MLTLITRIATVTEVMRGSCERYRPNDKTNREERRAQRRLEENG